MGKRTKEKEGAYRTSPVAEAARRAAAQRSAEPNVTPQDLIKVYVLEYRVPASASDEDGIDLVLAEMDAMGHGIIIDEAIVQGVL